MHIIMPYLTAIWAWIVSHPAVGVPVIGAIVVELVKPRTGAQYAKIAIRQPVWFFARWAAFLQLLGAIFPDPIKARKVILKMVFGDIEPMDPPKGPSILPILLLVGCLSMGSYACRPAQTPRETARATVLVVADAVSQLDQACASVAKAKRDAKLATSCADAYDVARASLVAAEDAVDAWDRGAAGDVPCATAKAVTALGRFRDVLTAAGGKLPAVVDDAFRLAPILTAACRV